MKIIVHEHKLEIDKTPVNEKELNITKIQFEFDEGLVGVKKAYFTLDDNNTYMKYIENNECDIPSEVLANKGQLEIGVSVETIDDNEVIKRYNPSPVRMQTWEGSYKDYQNAEPITPTDKEQIEQMLSNIQLGITKEGKIATITFTNKDGSTQTETLEDGKSIEYDWQGTSLGIRQEGESTYQYVNLKGDKGDAGAIKMLIVAELPETGADDTIYLVPLENPDVQGNNYAEYVYINNDWEELGEVGIQVDLTDYVKNTDYATSSKGGVVKIENTNGVHMTNGFLDGSNYDYAGYGSMGNRLLISKGTLENVITGKGLVSNTNYASSSTGGVVKTSNYYDTELDSSGALRSKVVSYAGYPNESNNAFISKGTLDNVLTAKIGDIQTLLDNLDSGSGV